MQVTGRLAHRTRFEWAKGKERVIVEGRANKGAPIILSVLDLAGGDFKTKVKASVAPELLGD